MVSWFVRNHKAIVFLIVILGLFYLMMEATKVYSEISKCEDNLEKQCYIYDFMDDNRVSCQKDYDYYYLISKNKSEVCRNGWTKIYD